MKTQPHEPGFYAILLRNEEKLSPPARAPAGSRSQFLLPYSMGKRPPQEGQTRKAPMSFVETLMTENSALFLRSRTTEKRTRWSQVGQKLSFSPTLSSVIRSSLITTTFSLHSEYLLSWAVSFGRTATRRIARRQSQRGKLG